MAASPGLPVFFVSWGPRSCDRFGEQPLDLRDGEWDHAGVGGRLLVRAYRLGGLGVGAVAEQGGGDGADRSCCDACFPLVFIMGTGQ